MTAPSPGGSSRPSQWATGKFFGVVAGLFLLQGLAGGALAHYRVEPGAFYGIDIASLSPLQPPTHVAPPARDLLDRNGMGGRGSLSRTPRGARGAEGATIRRQRALRSAPRRGPRQPPRRMAGPERPSRLSLVLVRPPGVGVSGPGAILAASPGSRPRALARSHVPSPPAGDAGRGTLRAGVSLPLLSRSHSALLPAGAVLRPTHQLRRHRQLALLDHPSLGGGVLRAVRDRPRGDDVPSDGPRERDDGHPRRLPRRHPLPGSGHHRHRPPLVLHGPERPEHGPRVGLLGDGGRTPDASHPGRLGLRTDQGPPLRRVRRRLRAAARCGRSIS